jgi:phosphopantothenoylcysteine decarboxylase/phosphopantothenate--cysteine ligase
MEKRQNKKSALKLEGRNILVGICAGIAAYKIPELVRMLIKDGANVKCVLTPNAGKFVTPLTLSTLSRNKVYEGMFDANDWEMEHISLSDWADVIVVAPATADAVSRLAQGRAGDLLSAVILASIKPVLVCPSMNTNMWMHKATVRNIETLKGFGYKIVQPQKGELACGTTGAGRLADLSEIKDSVINTLSK